MRVWLLVISCMFMTGCVNWSSQLMPENRAVKSFLAGSDCSYMFFGFGFGTNTIEQAMENSDPPIKTIRTITLDSFTLLFFGMQCIQVKGEAESGARPTPKYDPTESRP